MKKSLRFTPFYGLYYRANSKWHGPKHKTLYTSKCIKSLEDNCDELSHAWKCKTKVRQIDVLG